MSVARADLNGVEEEDTVHGLSDSLLPSEGEGKVGESTTDPCTTQLFLWRRERERERGGGRGRCKIGVYMTAYACIRTYLTNQQTPSYTS